MVSDGGDVKRVDKVKYLGVMLDQHLNGQVQAMNVVRKVGSRLGFLYRNVFFVDLNTRGHFYYLHHCCRYS